MSIRYPVMVFSFENPPGHHGVFAGSVCLEDRELALPSIRDCIEDAFNTAVQVTPCSRDSLADLYSDVFSKTAWAFLEQFNSETSGFVESVTLSTRCPWHLQVRVVNSDEEYWTHLFAVHLGYLLQGKNPPEDEGPFVDELADWAGISSDEARRLLGIDGRPRSLPRFDELIVPQCEGVTREVPYDHSNQNPIQGA